jgi:hypothetical protein
LLRTAHASGVRPSSSFGERLAPNSSRIDARAAGLRAHLEAGVEQAVEELPVAGRHDGGEHAAAPRQCRLRIRRHHPHHLVVFPLPYQIVRIEIAAVRFEQPADLRGPGGVHGVAGRIDKAVRVGAPLTSCTSVGSASRKVRTRASLPASAAS